jgi:large subunit ribosomal protein L17
MRHGKKVNHLSRTDSHRRAMLANMASSLILHKRITTTLAKAKALRVYVEPIITKSKDDTTYTRILKTGTRLGDNAEMCMIELVDFNEFIQDTPKAAPVKKATRRSRGAKKEEGTADAAASTEEAPAAEKPKRAPRKKKDDTQE